MIDKIIDKILDVFFAVVFPFLFVLVTCILSYRFCDNFLGGLL